MDQEDRLNWTEWEKCQQDGGKQESWIDGLDGLSCEADEI